MRLCRKKISPRGYGPKNSVVDSKIDFKLRPPGVLVAENSQRCSRLKFAFRRKLMRFCLKKNRWQLKNCNRQGGKWDFFPTLPQIRVQTAALDLDYAYTDSKKQVKRKLCNNIGLETKKGNINEKR